MVRVADTSALYAAFSTTDDHHADARAAMEDPEPVLVPSEIFAETVSLVHRRVHRDTGVAVGEFLRSLPHVEVQMTTQGVHDAAWEIFSSVEAQLSFQDAVVVALCRRQGVEALAFDRGILEALE